MSCSSTIITDTSSFIFAYFVGIIEQKVAASSPNCPLPFARSFTFLVPDGNHNKKFTILNDGTVTDSQCRGLCCHSRDCDFSFVEEGTCFGVSFLSNKNFVTKGTGTMATRKYLQMAIINRKQGRSDSTFTKTMH